MIDNSSPIIFKELVYQAIVKHSRQIFKYESRVLQDKDSEHLHQMRVGMRRLRSVIVSCALIVDLPDIVNKKNIAKISKSLGKLRDLDVLLAVLKNNYRPNLSIKEQKILDQIITSLVKQRRRELKQVKKTLNSRLYRNFRHDLSLWLKQPQYQKSAELPLKFILPDLLLPQISQLLLNPGWLVGIEITNEAITFPSILSSEAIEELLKKEDFLLHDLRKSAKTTRYSLELLAQVYRSDTYNYYLKQIKQLQEILGEIQDTHVLRKILEKNLKSAIMEKMPHLASLLLKTRYQKWLEWNMLQKLFLNHKTRDELRQLIQQPIILNHELCSLNQ